MRDYLRRVLTFAFRGFAIRTDVWYALISIAVSALTGGADKPLSDVTTHDLAIYFLTAVGVYLLLRLAAAPYFLWKEDQAKIAHLQGELDRPDREDRVAMRAHAVELRKKLSADLARYVGLTQLYSSKVLIDNVLSKRAGELIEYQMKIANSLQELSYDPFIRRPGWRLVTLCARIANQVIEKGPDDADFDRLRRRPNSRSR